MAWLRKTLSCPSLRALFLLHQLAKPTTSLLSARTYIAEMRKSAFQGNILRLLRNEIRYEEERCPPEPPITRFINSFKVDYRPGEQWIRLKKKFEDKEDIKIEATMFDGSVDSNSGGAGDNAQLHITFIVNISKGVDSNVLEIMCSAWPDTIEIKQLFVRGNSKTAAHLYVGPEFKDLDDKLQDSIYEFLEERGINDELAPFLHEYMKKKDKTEYIRWLRTVISYIEKK